MQYMYITSGVSDAIRHPNGPWRWPLRAGEHARSRPSRRGRRVPGAGHPVRRVGVRDPLPRRGRRGSDRQGVAQPRAERM